MARQRHACHDTDNRCEAATYPLQPFSAIADARLPVFATSKVNFAIRVVTPYEAAGWLSDQNEEKSEKTGPGTVKKVWHGGCNQVFNGEANAEWRSRKTRNGDKKMNGLIKQTKLDAVNQLGSFTIAFFSVIAVVYMLVGTV